MPAHFAQGCPPFHLNSCSGGAPSVLALGVKLEDDLLAFFQGSVAAVLCWKNAVSLSTKYSTLGLTYGHRAANHINDLASVVWRYVAFAFRVVAVYDLADPDARGFVHLASATSCGFAGGRVVVDSR
jgi:hypothetical protein